MKLFRSQGFWGGLLIVVGLFFLAESFGIFVLGSAWALLFLLGAVMFLMAFLSDHSRWWALIPAGVFTGVAATIGAAALVPQWSAVVGGTAVLFFLALSFLAIYVVTKGEHWWALIPGGILTTISVLVGLDIALSNFNGDLFVGLMFLGFALTFVLVALLPARDGPHHWAYWPAGVMGIMGLIFTSTATSVINYVWPVIFIVLGVVVLLRNTRKG